MKRDSVEGLKRTDAITMSARRMPRSIGPLRGECTIGHKRLVVRYHDASNGSTVPVVMTVFESSQSLVSL